MSMYIKKYILGANTSIFDSLKFLKLTEDIRNADRTQSCKMIGELEKGYNRKNRHFECCKLLIINLISNV